MILDLGESRGFRRVVATVGGASVEPKERHCDREQVVGLNSVAIAGGILKQWRGGGGVVVVGRRGEVGLLEALLDGRMTATAVMQWAAPQDGPGCGRAPPSRTRCG